MRTQEQIESGIISAIQDQLHIDACIVGNKTRMVIDKGTGKVLFEETPDIPLFEAFKVWCDLNEIAPF